MNDQQLKTIASLCAGVALLIMFAVVVTGDSSFLPSALKVALQNPQNSTAIVSSASRDFDNPGSYTWTAPEGVTSVVVTVIGGGGGGDAAQGPDNDGGCDCYTAGGGGAGGARVNQTVAVVPGQTYTVVVGAGGAGSPHTPGYSYCPSYFHNSVSGGDSSFGSVVATGGKSAAAGGAGGTPAGGAGCAAIGLTPPFGPFSTCGGSNTTGYGAGGTGGGCRAHGGNGANGFVSISTSYNLECELSLDEETISEGDSTTLRWSSTNGASMTFNEISGTHGPSGQQVVSPDTTTTYIGTIKSDVSVPKTILITSGSSWQVPSDWNPSNNSIEVIGGGASGLAGITGQNGTGPSGGCDNEGNCNVFNGLPGAGGPGSRGGGGGAYAKSTNLNLTPGSTVSLGVGSAGGDTWFNAASSAACSNANQCVKAKAGSGISGGLAPQSVGTTKFSGGNGTNGMNGTDTVGNNDGGSGGNGGAGGGAAGPHGPGGTSAGDGGNVPAGVSGQLWDVSHGPGGGGRAGDGIVNYNYGGGGSAGGAGGFYGAGGGGGGGGYGGDGSECSVNGGYAACSDPGYGVAGAAGGAGRPGIIAITYVPLITETCTATLNVGSVTPTPELTITGNGQNPAFVTLGDDVYIRATYIPATEDDNLIRTAINDFEDNLWCGTGCVINTPAEAEAIWTQTPLGEKEYTFETSTLSPGQYFFRPAAQTTDFPLWNDYGKSLTVTVCGVDEIADGDQCISNVCPGPNQDIDSECICNPGFHDDGSDPDSLTCVPNTCPGPNQNPANGCVCNPGFHDTDPGPGRTCVANACPGPHEDSANSCNCFSPYVKVSGVCSVRPTISSFFADQSRVRAGSRANLNWSVTGLVAGEGTSCSITSNPAGVFSQSMPADTAPAWNGSHVLSTGTITRTTSFTLSCTNAASKTITVGIIPGVIEI